MADQQAAADTRQAVINDAVAAALAAFHNAQAAARQGVQAPFALTPALANTGYIDIEIRTLHTTLDLQYLSYE